MTRSVRVAVAEEVFILEKHPSEEGIVEAGGIDQTVAPTLCPNLTGWRAPAGTSLGGCSTRPANEAHYGLTAQQIRVSDSTLVRSTRICWSAGGKRGPALGESLGSAASALHIKVSS